LRDRRYANRRVAARVIRARGLPIGLRIWAKVARRPIDSLAILAASVASIVIVVNAVFLQSGSRSTTDELERLKSKLQELRELLKSRDVRVQREIESGWNKKHVGGKPPP
jgi:hypothetical protein